MSERVAGPYLGDAPNPILLGSQRDAELDQGGRAVQRRATLADPCYRSPRKRTRRRIVAAGAGVVAPHGTRPPHAPYAAPVLRNSHYGEDGGRLYQEGRG